MFKTGAVLSNSELDACYMHVSCFSPGTCRDLGCFSGRSKACNRHGTLHIDHACYMHEMCTNPAWCIHESSMVGA